MAGVSTLLWPLALIVLAVIPVAQVARNKGDNVDRVTDIKDFKKLLRTKTNVLVIFLKTEKSLSSAKQKTLKEVAEQIRGIGTLIIVDCSNGKKLCKKFKASPSNIEMKHYKDGEYHKDYDRKETVKSLVNFMKDPKGDIPWDEESSSQDVLHINNEQSLRKLLAKPKKKALIMFYAPWCGFCKRLKPDYEAAATELKGESLLAAMDVNKPENDAVRMAYNITGFPTLLYFENGKLLYKYGGENNKEGIIEWMKNPTPPREPKKEEEWSDTESDVVHLTDSNFDEYISTHASVLVMFYAPWCGHCKSMKPEYTEAAKSLKEEKVEGTLAAVDATKHTTLGEKYKVKGFPTVKYFKDGKEAFDVNERTKDKLIEFMKDPKEPPPPPPPEAAWEDTESDVHHLTVETFKPLLKKKKHCLVMFYAPWCGHCKKAKPEFTAAAAKFKDESKVAFAAVDCTKQENVCKAHEVTGYPTLKYFNYGKNAQTYSGGREEEDFVNFMKDPLNPSSSAPTSAPSPESDWTDVEGSETLHHLTDSSFKSFIQEHKSVLVMFYAPWCGHCKAMKPAYAQAATYLKDQNIEGVLATVDATVQRSLQSEYKIQGFPTLKYFKNGQLVSEYEQGRSKKALIDFMKSKAGFEAKPAGDDLDNGAEHKWSDIPSAVEHLTQDNFDSFLSKKDHVLVMFYAPWCGHCQSAKPAYQAAADTLQNDSTDRHLAAVDCTSTGDLCEKQKVKGFPTFQYFHKGKQHSEYNGSREKKAFIDFIKNPTAQKDEL